MKEIFTRNESALGFEKNKKKNDVLALKTSLIVTEKILSFLACGANFYFELNYRSRFEILITTIANMWIRINYTETLKIKKKVILNETLMNLWNSNYLIKTKTHILNK